MRKNRRCRPVRPGSTVAIVVPSSPAQPALLEEGAQELSRLGFTVKTPGDPARKWRYLGGTDDERLADLKTAILDPEVSAVFCARGGYGLNRLLSRLDPAWFTDDPKLVIGSSDATCLLQYIHGRCGVPCIHGPMPAQDLRKGPQAYDRDLLLALLGSERPVGEIAPEGVERLRPGLAAGRLIGGCLSVLSSLIGTPFEPDPRGAILLLEDIAEKPYRIDRMLTTLDMAGWFERIRGIVFGQMPDCVQHPDQGYTLQEVILERLSGTKFPVLFGFPTGHTRSRHVPVPLGVNVEIDGDRGYVTVLEPLVRPER